MSRQTPSSPHPPPAAAAPSSPPTPPPLPHFHQPNKHDGGGGGGGGGPSIKLKVRNDHHHHHHHPSSSSSSSSSWQPPTGPYFFYGTLMDARMLMDVLRMKTQDEHEDHQPRTRRACMTGFSCMLWGQYPALVEDVEAVDVSGKGSSGGGGGGGDGGVVEGVVYHVRTAEEAEKLAAYETANYAVQRCVVRYTDGEEPRSEEGSVFVFGGNRGELREGTFDLGEWLRRMGRR